MPEKPIVSREGMGGRKGVGEGSEMRWRRRGGSGKGLGGGGSRSGGRESCVSVRRQRREGTQEVSTEV